MINVKQIIRDFFASVLLGAVLPGLLFFPVFCTRQQESTAYQNRTEHSEDGGLQLNVINEDGQVLAMDMNAYLTGVLLAEMPAEFEMEALKAQAVAARTFVLHQMILGGKHDNGDVCVKSDCCQAFCANKDTGCSNEAAIEKIKTAVLETQDEIVTYHGQIIEALYFSCSGGTTEDAAAVWGTECPYLKSVQSPGEEFAKCYFDCKSFSASEIEQVFSTQLSTKDRSWVKNLSYTEGGGVSSLEIGEKVISGTELRRILGLRSTKMQFLQDDDHLIISTLGNGHRVGLSQYGAQAMALSGKSYREILSYFYQGTQVSRLSDLKD